MKTDSIIDPETPISSEVGRGGSAVRDLILAVEFMRCACEQAEGKKKRDRERLSRAMSVGIRINARHKHLLDDYQKETFWEDVEMMPRAVGLAQKSTRPQRTRSPNAMPIINQNRSRKPSPTRELVGVDVPRLVGRHYRVTWRWDDPTSERHGELVTSNVYCPIGKAREFWETHNRSRVVRVRLTYPNRQKSRLPNANVDAPAHD
jgi:hypothetical protein